MKQCLLTVWLMSCILTATAQRILRITRVPPATPADRTLYVTGTFNGWDPANATYALVRNPDATYQLTLPPMVKGAVEFKFTQGSWSTVETDNRGQDIGNRHYTFSERPEVLEVQIENWKESGNSDCQSTALRPSVQVLSASFSMPQLGRTRRIWIYLPNSYATTPARRYPVLYMHDGQNVFDACTSFSGEWGVDETLRQLAADCIVVAVDNGGPERLNELSPWRNPQYGGGLGNEYVDFMVRTLKPYVDAHYRTLSGREFTGVAGSSMGGLISTYAALQYPAVYGKVGVFSPAFWFAKDSLLRYVRQHQPPADTRFYFVSGTTESETMVPLMQAMRDSLAQRGVPLANLQYSTPADGQHAEWFWKREFPAAYKWLYGLSMGTVPSGAAQPLAFGAYRNPAGTALEIQLPTVACAWLELTDAKGRRRLRQKVRAGSQVSTRQLPEGDYTVRVRTKQQQGTQLLVLE